MDELGTVVETERGTVLVTEQGARIGLAPPEATSSKAARSEATAFDPSVGVSANHRVHTDAEWQAPLAEVLGELGLDRLRALLEVRPVGLGEWFAEHAVMQLAPGRGCSSRPLWLAWMGTALDEVFVVLWAAEERAARRCVLELGLSRAARTTHVLLPHTLHRQLRRCAYESEDLELLPRPCAFKECATTSGAGEDATHHGAEAHAEAWPASWAVLPAPLHPATGPDDACDGMAWATLLVHCGESLARLRERRARAADTDEAAAREKQEEVISQLRAKDPGAEVDVTHDGQGKYVLNKISFNGHLFECPVIVNPYSDVKEIVRTATYRCLCC